MQTPPPHPDPAAAAPDALPPPPAGDLPVTPTRAAHRRAATWLAVLGGAVLAGSVLFAGGFLLGRQTALTDGTPQQLSADLQPFWDAFNSIEQRYAGIPVDRHTIVEGAINGMFKALGDPFSTYMTGEAYRASLTGLSGQFEGIGAVVASVDPSGAQGCAPIGPTCTVEIVRTIPGSPAERAGLRAGDLILAVDGAGVTGRTLGDVVTMVRGPRGTPVTLRIGRGPAAFEVRVVRDIINTPDVTSRTIANGAVGYIRISSFGSGVAADFRAQLRALLAGGVHGLVLDLRGNPGGFVDQARTIASQFIGSGPIYWEQAADGSRRAIDAEPGGIATAHSLPIVVLVDKGTASASEILAGALQDTGRATLLGTTTYGKGTVQEWQLLGQDMGGFRLTIARWLTPSKRWINGKGLTPDVLFQPPANTPVGTDPELDRAIQLIRGGGTPGPLAFGGDSG
jgi:carboxyl-terminal processing protease